jgi:hypothetical protein
VPPLPGLSTHFDANDDYDEKQLQEALLQSLLLSTGQTEDEVIMITLQLTYAAAA